MSMDYKDSGVDVEKGDALVSWLQESDGKTTPHQKRIISGIGGFASVFNINFPEMKDPCLVSATDGVGTKLKLAIDQKNYSGLGQDLVAMCVNDLVCTGARPLFFLDYFATGKLDLAQVKPFLKGLRAACHSVGCSLLGGETAEMPGLYAPKDFDCAGFAVGIVDREKMINPEQVKAGNTVIGLASSGFHSNGYSLLRRLFADDFDQFGEELLKPTALYSNGLLSGLYEKGLAAHAFAHITGGGINNIKRVLPSSLGVQFQSWEFSSLVKEAQVRGKLSDKQMLETFNCGIGMMLVIPEEQQSQWMEHLQAVDYGPKIIGKVIKSESSKLWWDGEEL